MTIGEVGDGWLDGPGFSASRVFEIRRGLGLPLAKVSFLSGDVDGDVTAVKFLPGPAGVWVSRRGAASLHTHDLKRELWRLRVDGWLDGPLWRGDTIVAGPDDGGWMIETAVADGRVVRRSQGVQGVLIGRTSTTLLYSCAVSLRESIYKAVDRQTFAVLWERPGLGGATAYGDAFVVDDALGTVLYCVDERRGDLRWTFELGTAAQRADHLAGRTKLRSIKAGFPSVVSVGHRLVLVLDDSTVVTLDGRTGAVIGRGAPPHPGIHLVTERSVFFLSASVLSEYDHARLKEVDSLDLRDPTARLYGSLQPLPAAFWLTEKSVIWTDFNGLILGVSRKRGPGGRHAVWFDRPEGAVMPPGAFPTAYGDYFYRSEMGEPLGLHCYAGAPLR